MSTTEFIVLKNRKLGLDILKGLSFLTDWIQFVSYAAWAQYFVNIYLESSVHFKYTNVQMWTKPY